MATLVTRSGKGSPLTHAEVDANFTNLNTDKLELSGGTMTGNINFNAGQTFDGRDVSADGTKLDGIETNADVTDTANVTAAGALMDSELADIAAVKALNQGVATTDDPTFTNTQLAAISETISDTAVDIFVYDTRKDSDGGAWRKRTQHTSWYNETLNTATRGSRKEFPAVAVIVAESSQVTIYDGDDPDLPMWMVFNAQGAIGSASNIITANADVTSIVAMNGIMCFGMDDSSTPEGVFTVSFISEVSRCYRTVGSGYTGAIYTGSISTRNNNRSYEGDYNQLAIVNQAVNDVAMTVLPNAPIDAATGLPVPTIAVATAGGISFIRDDETVVDITVNSESPSVVEIDFLDDNRFTFASGSNNSRWWVDDIPTADENANYYYQATKYDYGSNPSNIDPVGRVNGTSRGEKGEAIYRANDGMARVRYEDEALNYTTSSYNTGWMNGDIKLATLSDTDDTDVTGSELVTNGTFDTDVSGWTPRAGTTATVVSGRVRVSGDGTGSSSIYPFIRQAITTVVGETYTATVEFEKYSSGGDAFLQVGLNGGAELVDIQSSASSGTLTGTFVATGTSTDVTLVANIATSTTTGTGQYFDNISVRLAEKDRSVNGNGLQVFGSITKNPVATGADLVAYSGFSSGNYLSQPYNSDLDFGTGDFCVMGWINVGDTSLSWILDTIDAANTEGFAIYKNDDGTVVLRTRNGSNTQLTSSSSIESGTWRFIAATVTNSATALSMYIDGILDAQSTGQVARSIGGTDSPLILGGRNQAPAAALNGSLALWRISATAPSPEQIARIYNDEKHLFTEGAQATLYGSSDSVTALAFDDTTNLLHVGTSAGRSVFQGLRRVDNTTTAVGAAISASNGLVADE